MNRFRLLHVTEFKYDAPVTESYNEVHLQPQDDELQSCVSFQLRTRPGCTAAVHRDYFDNWVHRFNLLGPHRHLRIEAESVVMVHAPRIPREGLPPGANAGPPALLAEEQWEWLAPSTYVPHVPVLEELARAADAQSGGNGAGFVLSATELVRSRFRYAKGATHVHSSVEDVLATRTGVCQDFAHLLLAIARVRGLPARYVSGYLVPRSAREGGSTLEEVSGGQASHAWAEVYIPGPGWIGVDPTLGKPVSTHHVRIAYGRDYGDVPPVKGIYKGHAGQRLSVDVRVRPILDDDGCELMLETPPNRRITAAPEELLAGQ